jgi:hypothetical protein
MLSFEKPWKDSEALTSAFPVPFTIRERDSAAIHVPFHAAHLFVVSRRAAD